MDGTQSWSRNQFGFDAAGRHDYSWVFHDNGTYSYTDVDQTSANDWLAITHSFDAQSNYVGTTVFYDNGSVLIL